MSTLQTTAKRDVETKVVTKKSKPARPGATGTTGTTRKPPMASKADRHVLYQDSVQCVEAEIDFIDDTYKDIRGKRAAFIREDFCGTANTSCEWVKRRRTNRAIGVDLDLEVLGWGKEHNIDKLRGNGKERIELLSENVLTVKTAPVDMVLAMNFSYQIFTDRAMLLAYFVHVRESLADDGVFFLDNYGGYESYKTSREKREIDDDVTYVWDQAEYNPITGDMACFIHFNFSDGSKIKKAFEYHWRMWTLPELRDLLTEAGFSKVTVYWEGVDEDSEEGDGNFEPTLEAEQDPAWICYIGAEK